MGNNVNLPCSIKISIDKKTTYAAITLLVVGINYNAMHIINMRLYLYKQTINIVNIK